MSLFRSLCSVADCRLPDQGEQGFNLPAVAAEWSPAQRETLRHLARGDGAEAYRAIRDAAEVALVVPPQAQRELFCEGLLPDHPVRIQTVERLQDISRLHVLGYTWLVEDDPRYAAHAAAIIRAWADTYQPTGNAINENKFASLSGSTPPSSSTDAAPPRATPGINRAASTKPGRAWEC